MSMRSPAVSSIDQDAVVARIAEVAGHAADDEVEFLSDTAVARPIREEAFYPGFASR